MGCNCSKGRTESAKKYVYTAPDGTKTTYSSEIEAQTAKVRRGGSYTTVSR